MKLVSTQLFTLFLILAAACSSADKSALITQQELLSRISDNTAPIVIDVRTEKEYKSGHVPGAILIPFDNYEQALNALNLDKNKEIASNSIHIFFIQKPLTSGSNNKI